MVFLALPIILAVGQLVPDKRLPIEGDRFALVNRLVLDVRRDIENEIVRYEPGKIQIDANRIHYTFPLCIDPWVYADVPINELYWVEAVRETFSKPSQPIEWRPYIEQAEDRVKKDIIKQITTRTKLTEPEGASLQRDVASILTKAITDYARKLNLEVIAGVNPAPAYPCLVVLTTNKGFSTVRMMPLTKYRMAVTYSEPLTLFIYAIGRKYSIQAGSYVYFFDNAAPSNSPPAVKIYEDGEVRL